MPPREAWSRAYYRQARSDWSLYRELQGRSDVPVCHALHHLQMATEKLSKAYRFRDTQTPEEHLLGSHVGFPRFLNTFLRSPAIGDEYRGRSHQLETLRRSCIRIARAVERLAPAVDRPNQPSNVEYPWAEGEQVRSPVEFDFSELALLSTHQGRTFLKLIDRAFNDYDEATVSG